MYRWLFDVLLGGQAVSNMWELVWANHLGLSTIGPVAAVERRMPRVGRGVRVGVRAVGVGAAVTAALPFLVRVLRIVRDVERRLAGED